MTLSFIIPAYNATGTLQKCLNSIYALPIQEQEFEVIVVDDCSTDNTLAFLQDYAANKNNMLVFHQERNQRQGAARNRGLLNAKGKYIIFVDSDDYLLTGFVEAMKIANETNADMTYYSTELEQLSGGTSIMAINYPKDSIMVGAEFCERYHQEGVFWYPWSYIIRKDYLLQLNYPFIEGRQHEDRDWLAYVLCHANSVTYSHTPAYYYTINPNSTCHAAKYSTVCDHVASGIRHINLARDIQHQCPNLSNTLLIFGKDEIYKSLRLRNLSKYSWEENKNLYNQQHLLPLLPDLKKNCQQEHLPFAVKIVAYAKPIENIILFLAAPIATFSRKVVQTIRKIKY